MTVSTQGLQLRSGSRVFGNLVELLSSMRFAISLLTVICIASVIGTVVKQHEPLNNYVNQFGPFWAEVFGKAGLFTVYSAWWFLLILAFLVVSTSLCIARNTPKIFADFKAFKENIREQSLKSFPHRAEGALAEAPEAAAHRVGQTLLASGWRVKLQSRALPEGLGWMVAAKKGTANKIGYLAAHSAIVLVCIGGLLDGDLIVRAQMWFNGKTPFSGGGMIADVPAQHRLSPSNPTFRGNLLVTEGTSSSTALLSQSDGVLLQELPFSVELKKFIVEYYETGMPKLFASEIVIHDHETGEKRDARVEVNHPASHRGINIYQSSFDDGGSRVTLQAQPMGAFVAPFEVSGVIGGSTPLTNGDSKLSLEYTGLRVINVENFSNDADSGTDVRKVDLRESIESRLGSGHKTVTEKKLRNVGPSITYKLRDAAGQAVEPGKPELVQALEASAQRAMALFSGAEKLPPARDVPPGRDAEIRGGLPAVSEFLETNVPEAERERASEVLVRILNGTLFELAQISREKAGLPPLPRDDATQQFMSRAVLSLSDSFYYPAPMSFQLKDFQHVQASVFQVARAPGQTIVYLGCVLLILGVFAMLYVRERRVWIWLAPAHGGSQASMALSSNRKTMESDQEFDQLKTQLLKVNA